MKWLHSFGLAAVMVWVTGAEAAEGAVPRLQSALKSPTGYMELVAAYREGRFAQATEGLSALSAAQVREEVGRFLASSPEPSDALGAGLLHSDLLREAGGRMGVELRRVHLDSARKLFESIPETASLSALRAQWLLCLGYLSQSLDPSESWDRLTAARQIAPEDGWTALGLGVWHEVAAHRGFDSEELLRAEKRYRQALEEEPELMAARLRLGSVLLRQEEGSEEDARKQLELVIERSSEGELVYLAHLFLGDLHRQQGLLDQAIRSYQSAVAVAPHWQTAYLALSQALDANGEAPEAIDALKKALKLPLSAEAHRDPYPRYRRGLLVGIRHAMEMMRRELVP